MNMNALSGLGSISSPEFRALAGSLQQAGGVIPPSDLAKLTTGQPAMAPSIVGPSGPAGDSGFSQTLGSFVREVNQKQNSAAASVNDLLAGNGVTLHQAMVSMLEANVSFQLMVEVRNKLLESYQELMRMQI